MKTTATEAISVPTNLIAVATLPEFGHWNDVQHFFCIRRGILYNLMAEGKIKSVVLQRKGNFHGCWLTHPATLSHHLNSLIAGQTETRSHV